MVAGGLIPSCLSSRGRIRSSLPVSLEGFIGICPGKNESAGKRKSGRIRKGNPYIRRYIRRLLCEFALAASRTESTFKAKFQGLLVRRGRKRAIVAIAHKLLRTIFFMLKRGQHYRDTTVNYEEMTWFTRNGHLVKGKSLTEVDNDQKTTIFG